jgi:glucokinase
MDLVSVDLGGTHARFALASLAADGSIVLGEPATLHTRDHASFETAWEHFATLAGRPLPRAAALSVAGPVGGERSASPTTPGCCRPLPERLGVDKLTIVNDFGAVGHAVARADAEHFQHLAGPDVPLPATGTITIVGPGTGLAWRMCGATAPASITCRPPKAAISTCPADAIEDAILARLRQRHRRVSVERVVSARPLWTFTKRWPRWKAAPIPTDDRTIWSAGAAREDTLMAAAVERFCLCLGSAAGDYALAQGGSAVVIAGGLGLRIKESILASGFADRFRAKGRFEAMMAALPCASSPIRSPACWARRRFSQNTSGDCRMTTPTAASLAMDTIMRKAPVIPCW